jgi:hypothetical protein
VTVSAQDLEDFNTWRVLKVECEQGARKISEGVREKKLRRDSSLFMLVGTGLGEIRTKRKLGSRRILKRKRIDDLKLSSRSRSPADVRSGGAARELTRRRTEESGCHRISAYRGWRVQELHARRNRELRFPDLIGAVDHRRDRWHEIPRSRDSALRRFQSRKEHGDSRSAKTRVATGPTETVWRTTRGIAHRHFGV